MRLLSRMLLLFALCLMPIALPALPVQAAPCVPWDIELSPEYGPPGTEVEVCGHDFEPNEFVDIYYDVNGDGHCTADERISEGSRTNPGGGFTIAFTIPEGCTGQYEVRAVVGSDLGSVERHHYFTVKPGLTVSPDNGPPGTTVTVEGRGFAKNEDGIELFYYYLSGDHKTIERSIRSNALGSWETGFEVPLSGRGEHKIDAQGVESKYYEVQDASFTVTAGISLDESSGFVGDPVTMRGSRFAAYEKGIQVLFGGQAVAVDIEANSEGEWETSFTVPEMPAGEHDVTAEGEETKKEAVGGLSFEIRPYIVLSPTEGHVGTNLTVTGHGFVASEELVITYNDNQVATPMANDKGSFDVSFPAPETPHGEHKVTAGYAGENHANAIFTIESAPPPAPTLLSPSNRSRLGFIGEVTPTFEWSEVSDDSGVAHYRLQVASSDDFSTSSIIDSRADLTGTSYTLSAALPQGTYYWSVKAVDGAENGSDWSTAYSFRVGLLPKWAFIAIIVAVVVLISALIRALIRRRGIYYDRW